MLQGCIVGAQTCYGAVSSWFGDFLFIIQELILYFLSFFYLCRIERSKIPEKVLWSLRRSLSKDWKIDLEGKLRLVRLKMKSIVAVLHLLALLLLLGCCAAFPVKPEDASPLDPIFLQDSPTNLGSKVEDDPSPVAYVIVLLGKLDGSERKFDGISIEKRDVEEKEDLEPAAGTYALRPLFVYRQQVAYRQRLRNSRQGNGFWISR